jgi:3-oxoacyl-[acyl-carrier-protein] synthase III
VPGLSRIGTYVPGGREAVGALLDDLGRPDHEIRRFERLFGLRQVPVLEGELVEDLLVRAVAELAETEDLGAVGLVLYGHTAVPQVPWGHDLLGRVLERFDLAHVQVYGISHVNCAALLKATELACRYVEHFPERAVLVIGGDHASVSPESRLVPGVATMGDAAAAFLVTAGESRYRYVAGAWRQDSRFHRGVLMDADELKEFTPVYMGLLVDVIADCLAASGMRLADLDHILPHNVNELTWSRFAQETGFPRERIFLDLVGELGHTMTTDAFLNLDTADRGGRLAAGDRCLLVAVGTGCYFAACTLEVAPEGETA